MKLRFGRILAVVTLLGLILAACSGGSGDTTTTVGSGSSTTTTNIGGEVSDLGLPVVDPLDVVGGVDIGIAGSSTVFPLSTAVLTQWIDEGGPEYTIDSIGSGGGLERFCVEGASDIANASRAIKDEEVAACEAIGRTPIEVRVGSDALSLVISLGNYFAQDLTLEEIATAFSLTSADATWADVNSAYPAHPIQLFSPGADSGTFDYFNEIVFDEAQPSPILNSIAEIVGEDDNLTVVGVSEDGCTEGDLASTCAIGYFGYAYFQENVDVLQAVAVDGVVPSAATVDDNSYPISRPLFMYTAASVIDEKPQVAEFIAYYLNNVNEVIGEVGYFPAPQSALQDAANNIKAAAGWE
ncbi:MAG: substrate-binding domain-containing protein [Acidimicrobiia bacterium]|nr:substrate-binding domain-containing protein [Acidimicrobiia bacterium]